jgi:PAS domain S-box-containing protein
MTGTERLFERSPIGMALHDRDLRYTAVNSALAEMFGMTPAQMVGRTPTELHGDGAREAEEHMRTVLRTGRCIRAMEVAGTVRDRPDDVRRWVFTCFALGDGGLAVLLGDVTERRRTESWLTRQHARNALLATAARELDVAAGVPRLAQRVAELVVPSLADWAHVELMRDDGALELVAEARLDGRPGRRDEVMEVPLSARGHVLGRLVLGASQDDRLGEDELVTARMLAEHAALALDGAQLAARQTQVATQLQAGLLPPILPTVPELELAARYRAAGAGSDVGGDFYDAFATEKDWVLVIGDVAGKGPAAAAITGLARHTLRTAARYEADPADALTALNDAMLQQLAGQRHCTAALVRMQVEDDGVRAAVRCAGHPPALVLRPGGDVQPVGRPGHPLGILDEPTFRDETALLSSGDVLLLYTDGVTEAGGGDGALGEDGLADVLQRADGLQLAALLGRIEAAVAERGTVRDDIALLAARVR